MSAERIVSILSRNLIDTVDSLNQSSSTTDVWTRNIGGEPDKCQHLLGCADGDLAQVQ